MIIKFENDNYVNTAKATDYYFYNDTKGVRRLEVCFYDNKTNPRIAVTPQQEQALKEAIASGQKFIDLDNLEPTYSIEDLYRTIYSIMQTDDMDSSIEKVTGLLREVFGNPELDVNYYASPSKTNFIGVYLTVDYETIPLEVFLFNRHIFIQPT